MDRKIDRQAGKQAGRETERETGKKIRDYENEKYQKNTLYNHKKTVS